MVSKLTVRGFKSLEHVEVDLGQVNVFVGANGSGKSNLLEALGVLSACAEGKVTDQALLQRGVRPGVPRIYKTAFRAAPGHEGTPRHLSVRASSEPDSVYEVTLNNPLGDPSPAWRFKHELWREGPRKLVGRSPASIDAPHKEQGLAALRAVEQVAGSPALQLLQALAGYVIYTPTTPVLRGISPEGQPREPVGLSGGRLPTAVRELLRQREPHNQAPAPAATHARQVCSEALRLVDWAHSYGTAAADSLPLSPSAASSPLVVKFVDRFMVESRNVLSGYDASEGALYVLFLAVLAAHSATPHLYAVDNADHGLNPRLARALMKAFCDWSLSAPLPRQALLTTHNPAALDGLPLHDGRVRLFTVARTTDGRTDLRRIVVDDALKDMADRGWTLSRLWVMGHLGGVPDV
jgi:energy-coupling factor transporter ATP-binding protein EcfA2